MLSQVYPSELQLNKANTSTSDTEALFLDLHLSISNDIVSTKIYNKHEDFDFEMSISHFRWRSLLYILWSYISQLFRFARASSHVADFNTHNKLLAQNFFKQGYRYHKLHKTFV